MDVLLKVALAGAVILPGPGWARPVKLESSIEKVWEYSPSVQATQELADLAEGDRLRRFIFNEPQFQYSDTDDHSAHSYGVSLTTSFPGKTLALTQVDRARARALKAELRAKKYDLAKLTAQAYLDCASAKESAKLQKITALDLETLFNSLRSAYENGHSSQAEKIGAELQSRQAKLDLLTAEDKEISLCKKLNAFLHSARVDEYDLTKDETKLPEDWDPKIIAALGTETADEGRAIAGVDTANAAKAIAWWMQLPDLTLAYSRNHYLYQPASPSGKEWANSFSLSITVPILFPFHEAVEASRSAAQAVLDRNSSEISLANAAADRLDGALEYRRSNSRLSELRAHDLPLAEALVESTYSAYRSGKLGYAELILSRKTLNDIRNQDIQLRVSILNAHLKCLTNCGDS